MLPHYRVLLLLNLTCWNIQCGVPTRASLLYSIMEPVCIPVQQSQASHETASHTVSYFQLDYAIGTPREPNSTI